MTLVREPRNPYDRNAIRVDNLRGEKVGHVKATQAKNLAPVMDRNIQLGVRLEGTIPRKGNAYTVSDLKNCIYLLLHLDVILSDYIIFVA